MGKRFKKIFFRVIILLLVSLVALIYFSPFSNEHGKITQIRVSILIKAPVKKVFDFMGDSKKASDWSVYVHHISPLNLEEFEDGSVGCLRRCFCEADENKQRWDEEITEVIPNKKRKLKVFNFVDFPMQAKGLVTEQLYETKNNGDTKLSLLIYYADNEVSWWDWFKTKLGAYRIRGIFQENLENIKKQIESNNE